MTDTNDTLIPPTPTAEEYAKEADQQEAFSADADQGDVFADHDDPMALFSAWLALAKEHEINDPNAMTIATVDESGWPDARIVLLKDVNDGFSFYTNAESAKGLQLQRNPRAALVFHWKSIRRQVRVRGRVRPLPAEVSDAYFASRDRGSQIGAWASQQSREMQDREILTTRIGDYESLFQDRDVPRPDFWRGFSLVPERLEFWVNRPFRLHDRKLFYRDGDGWETAFLFP